jgi:hypothetical protein
MAASDTIAAPLAGPAAAGLLDGAAAAGLELAGLDVAGLDVDVLVPLEQAAASRPIPATPAALAIHFVMMALPLWDTSPGGARGYLHRVPDLQPTTGVLPY